MDIFFAAAPIAVLVVTLAALKFPAYLAALCAFASALAIALGTAAVAGGDLSQALSIVGSQFPALGAATLEGVKTGCYPIGLVVVAALFTHAITVETKQIGVIQSGLMGLSDDHRFLALLIAWGFGSFMEGMAGFGTAVAIPCALLVGMGFDPLKAVLCCLVANTTTTAFGSVGVPTMVLAKEAGLDEGAVTRAAAFLQLLITALGPFFVLLIAGGWRGLREKWPLALLCSVAFIVPWLVVACFVGCELPDIIGGIAVMLALGAVGNHRGLSPREQLRAWMPFAFVVIILGIGAALPPRFKVSPGILILVAATAGGLCLRLPATRLAALLARTVWKYKAAIFTICLVSALAKVMNASGMIGTLADALVAATGRGYAFFSPVVGSLGGLVTGSGTNSNILFGSLQSSIGAGSGHALLFTAANVMGAGIGKMVCAQSIVLGCAAAGLAGRESEIFRKAALFFVPIVVLAGVVTLAAALIFK